MEKRKERSWIYMSRVSDCSALRNRQNAALSVAIQSPSSLLKTTSQKKANTLPENALLTTPLRNYALFPRPHTGKAVNNYHNGRRCPEKHCPSSQCLRDERSRANRLRPQCTLVEQMEHPHGAHERRRQARVPRSSVHPQRSRRLQALRRVAGLVFPVLAHGDFHEEEY